jgi:hypothetical protein
VRLRDIAASLGITDRSAYGIVTDLTAAGHVVSIAVAGVELFQVSHVCSGAVGRVGVSGSAGCWSKKRRNSALASGPRGSV